MKIWAVLARRRDDGAELGVGPIIRRVDRIARRYRVLVAWMSAGVLPAWFSANAEAVVPPTAATAMATVMSIFLVRVIPTPQE